MSTAEILILIRRRHISAAVRPPGGIPYPDAMAATSVIAGGGPDPFAATSDTSVYPDPFAATSRILGERY